MQVALANECPTLNLISQKNSPFEKIPVYDQDGIGICYAYAASQLADYYLIKNGQSRRTIHPLWAALKLSELWKKDYISTGSTSSTLDELIKKGNCDYSIISRSLSTWAHKANISEANVMALIETYVSKLKSAKYQKRRSLMRNEIDSLINQTISEQKQFCPPHGNLPALIPELKSLTDLNSLDFFSRLIFPGCQSRIYKPSFPAPKNLRATKKELWPQLIAQKLKSIDGPISISYCSNILYDSSYKWKMNTKGCAAHASLIVGMKKVGSSCKFLLRNSWGNGFGKSTHRWNCFCRHKRTNAFVDDCSYKTHNNGQYSVEGCWIDSEALGNNIASITLIEDTLLSKMTKKFIPWIRK
jgi:hypothetical protein